MALKNYHTRPEKAPKGMREFLVVGATIKDSCGIYCEDKQIAYLTEDDTRLYGEAGNIRLSIPDFDEDAADEAVLGLKDNVRLLEEKVAEQANDLKNKIAELQASEKILDEQDSKIETLEAELAEVRKELTALEDNAKADASSVKDVDNGSNNGAKKSGGKSGKPDDSVRPKV